MGLSLSSKQMAELVRVSVRTLRHYHQIGLLPEPERLANNYRVYGLDHVLQMLRIKRLSEFGLSLEQIKRILRPPAADYPRDVLCRLDQKLAEQVERLESQRRTIALILQAGAPLDVLPEYAQHIKALRNLGEGEQDLELDKILIELIAGAGNVNEVVRLTEALNAAIDSPDLGEFKVLEERFDALDSGSSDVEIETLAAEYAKAVAGIGVSRTSGTTSESSNRQGRGSSLQQALTELTSHRFNAQQQRVLERAAEIFEGIR